MNHLVDSINSGQLNQQSTVTNDQERAALSQPLQSSLLNTWLCTHTSEASDYLHGQSESSLITSLPTDDWSMHLTSSNTSAPLFGFTATFQQPHPTNISSHVAQTLPLSMQERHPDKQADSNFGQISGMASTEINLTCVASSAGLSSTETNVPESTSYMHPKQMDILASNILNPNSSVSGYQAASSTDLIHPSYAGVTRSPLQAQLLENLIAAAGQQSCRVFSSTSPPDANFAQASRPIAVPLEKTLDPSITSLTSDATFMDARSHLSSMSSVQPKASSNLDNEIFASLSGDLAKLSERLPPIQPASRFRKSRIRETVEQWSSNRISIHDCRLKAVPSWVSDLQRKTSSLDNQVMDVLKQGNICVNCLDSNKLELNCFNVTCIRPLPRLCMLRGDNRPGCQSRLPALLVSEATNAVVQMAEKARALVACRKKTDVLLSNLYSFWLDGYRVDQPLVDTNLFDNCLLNEAQLSTGGPADGVDYKNRYTTVSRPSADLQEIPTNQHPRHYQHRHQEENRHRHHRCRQSIGLAKSQACASSSLFKTQSKPPPLSADVIQPCHPEPPSTCYLLASTNTAPLTSNENEIDSCRLDSTDAASLQIQQNQQQQASLDRHVYPPSLLTQTNFEILASTTGLDLNLPYRPASCIDITQRLSDCSLNRSELSSVPTMSLAPICQPQHPKDTSNIGQLTTGASTSVFREAVDPATAYLRLHHEDLFIKASTAPIQVASAQVPHAQEPLDLSWQTESSGPGDLRLTYQSGVTAQTCLLSSHLSTGTGGPLPSIEEINHEQNHPESLLPVVSPLVNALAPPTSPALASLGQPISSLEVVQPHQSALLQQLPLPLSLPLLGEGDTPSACLPTSLTSANSTISLLSISSATTTTTSYASGSSSSGADSISISVSQAARPTEALSSDQSKTLSSDPRDLQSVILGVAEDKALDDKQLKAIIQHHRNYQLRIFQQQQPLLAAQAQLPRIDHFNNDWQLSEITQDCLPGRRSSADLPVAEDSADQSLIYSLSEDKNRLEPDKNDNETAHVLHQLDFSKEEPNHFVSVHSMESSIISG
ncbi:unnamed protein product [Protopolystoma xenopodis]|uniref:Uncharacterized protein n=1 Tax=Protopolystoma xenopodis TaxID=117903 RepID=A0A448WG46_9PLAT|nr:unnamed protein product [Protopolystoma xenopodis]